MTVSHPVTYKPSCRSWTSPFSVHYFCLVLCFFHYSTFNHYSLQLVPECGPFHASCLTNILTSPDHACMLLFLWPLCVCTCIGLSGVGLGPNRALFPQRSGLEWSAPMVWCGCPMLVHRSVAHPWYEGGQVHLLVDSPEWRHKSTESSGSRESPL